MTSHRQFMAHFYKKEIPYDQLSEGAKQAVDRVRAGRSTAAEELIGFEESATEEDLRNNENNEATGDTGPHNNEETGMKDEGNKKASTEGAPVANAAPAAPVATPETLETVLAGIKDGGLRALVAEGVETAKAEKAKLVEKLAVNGAFTKDELEAMPTVNLRKIDVALAKAVETAKPVVNEPAGAVRVAAGAAPVVNAANGQGVPQMPSLFEKK